MTGLRLFREWALLVEEQPSGIDGAQSDVAIIVDLGDDSGTWEWLELPAWGTVAVIVDDAANGRDHMSPLDWNAIGETR
jgi:hypothetical protein